MKQPFKGQYCGVLKLLDTATPFKLPQLGNTARISNTAYPTFVQLALVTESGPL